MFPALRASGWGVWEGGGSLGARDRELGGSREIDEAGRGRGRGEEEGEELRRLEGRARELERCEMLTHPTLCAILTRREERKEGGRRDEVREGKKEEKGEGRRKIKNWNNRREREGRTFERKDRTHERDRKMEHGSH